MRLRQIALVGKDLAAAKADIVAVLGLGGDYADPDSEGCEPASWCAHHFLPSSAFP